MERARYRAVVDSEQVLLDALAQLADLLEQHGEDHWAQWFRTDLTRLQRGDGYALDHVLRAFGGMGSINDLMLCQANGHAVAPSDEAALDDQLRGLLDLVHRAATALR